VASAELSRRVEKVVGYPPLCELDTDPRREFREALLEAVPTSSRRISDPRCQAQVFYRPRRLRRYQDHERRRVPRPAD
jgi:hypothetical protein